MLVYLFCLILNKSTFRRNYYRQRKPLFRKQQVENIIVYLNPYFINLSRHDMYAGNHISILSLFNQ